MAVTEYFTGLAGVYARHRPSYPDAAIDWMLHGLQMPIRAADVGCGTGISARMLAARGLQVIAIDPNQDMLEQARRDTPSGFSIEYRTGRGEATGLDNASVDLVLCAQSFHWFNAEAALREFHRVLKPLGRLALMWNVKNERDAFTAGYMRNTERAQAEAAKSGLVVPSERDADPALGGRFSDVRRRKFPNAQRLTMDALLGRARSASYFPKHGPMKQELEGDLWQLFAQHQKEGVVALSYITQVTLATRM